MFARHQRPYILYFQWVATNTCCRRRTPTLPHCGQMGNLLPTSFGTLQALLPTCLWGQSPNSRSSPPSCCPFSAIRFAASGLILFGFALGLLRGFGEDGGRGYAGRRRSDGDGFGRRRKSIELGYRSRVAGDAGIGVGVSASGSAVVKGNTYAGNRVAVLVCDEHGEALGQ